MKSNPLFVDSTKFHGDLIGTNIELRNVLVYDDEQLFVVVVNHHGQPKRLAMKPSEENERSFEARIHLNHQTRVSYRFEIEKGGAMFLRSTDYTGRAQYAILEEWQPLEEMASAVPLVTMVQSVETAPAVVEASTLPTDVPAVSSATVGGSAWARESAQTVRNLIDKFDF